MNVDDDVTFNAKIARICSNGELCVILKSGQTINIKPTDVNTVRPKIVISEIDHRKGN